MAEPITDKSGMDTSKGMDKVRDSVRRIDQAMPEGREGTLTMNVERQTSRIPSIAFLSLAVASMAGSAAAEFFSDRKFAAGRPSNLGTFIGLWAPTFLLLGIYNKIVKLEGSDRYHKEGGSSFGSVGGGSSRYY